MVILLRKIRLTYFYPVLFAVFLIVVFKTPKIQMSGGPLTLFSVNSFLLAFYLGPILAGQKTRIDDLSKAVRLEAISFANMLIEVRSLSPTTQHDIREMTRSYLKSCVTHHARPSAGAREYERLLEYNLAATRKDKERDSLRKISEALVQNQQNRGQVATLLRAGVYSHEWLVLAVLFSITISYVVIIDYGGSAVLNTVAALLCAGLTLLLLILQKLNSLTHKRAKEIWAPFQKLLSSNLQQME